MSEIKHNFMKGKMNKDLDERLVPNGEYRDALNVQVSTSEGSDVGTVQNILGNSMIAGQDFIGENAVCVGSVADEKDDKLYYFITNKPLQHDGFGNTDGAWVYGGGIATYDGTAWEWVDIQLTGLIIPGRTYAVSFTVATVSGNPIKVRLGGQTSDGVFTEGRQTVYITADFTSSSTQNSVRFYAAEVAGITTRWNGTISNVEIVEQAGSIIEYDSKTNTITPVLVDISGDVLKFQADNIITGINIIDDSLLWTDNINEPRKINIPRCKEGTDPSGLIHTDLIVEDVNEGLIKEEHITVIKKSPSRSPGITTKTNGRTGFIEGDFLWKKIFHPIGNNYAEVVDGDEMWIGIQNIGGYDWQNTGTSPNLVAGDIIRVYEGFGAPAIDPVIQTPIARLLIKDIITSGGFSTSQAQNDFTSSVVAYSHQTAIKVSVSSFVSHPVGSKYFFRLEEDQEGIFERKFPRFASRYKYEDNEYSSVGPFSEVVFLPGEFKYHPTKAYNEGMINSLRELTLKDFVALDIPTDVVSVDLLYKNEFSPNIYVVKSVDRDSTEWNDNKYTINTENIYAQLPSDQLIRPWDNVPKTALAQEITGNRVVYGNYTQGYDITTDTLGVGTKITPIVKATLDERLEPQVVGTPSRSLKSQRTYNFGIVYGDKYGRETPVFTNESAYQLITKSSSATANSVMTSIETDHPDWADYYKVFVKETANEYYNLAMGRVYDAEDGNVWISFPSADRNKIDEDTYLILKKGVGAHVVGAGNGAVIDEARYKVVAIENEAPDYIKTEYTVLAEVKKKIDGVLLFGGNYDDGTGPDYTLAAPAEAPYSSTSSFTIDKVRWTQIADNNWSLGLDDLIEMWNDNKSKAEVYVSFSNLLPLDPLDWSESPTSMSNKYRVTSITTAPDSVGATSGHLGWKGNELYRVTIAETIPQSEAWLTDYFQESTPNPSAWWHGGRLRPHFYKKEVKNKPEFDGRFFVKILEDEVLTRSLRIDEGFREEGYRVTTVIPHLYHLKDGTGVGETGHATTGHGDAKSTGMSHWHDNLGGVSGYTSGSRWFIDETHFAGTQQTASAHPKDSITTNDGTPLCDDVSDQFYANYNPGSYFFLDPSTVASGYPDANTTDYHAPYLEKKLRPWGTGGSFGAVSLKGIHNASYNVGSLANEHLSGHSAGSDHYLHLSYGGINPRPNTGTIATPPSGDYFSAAWYRGYYWNVFNDDKNWNVGGGGPSNQFGGTNASTDDQADIVSKLSPGKIFRMNGDSTIYKILGVTKRRLYNFMGNMRWDEADVLEKIPSSNWYQSSTAFDLQYNLHHLGGYLNLAGSSGVDWYDASGTSPAHLVNTVDPADLEDLVKVGNQNVYSSSESYLWNTSRRKQHQFMTLPENCRISYLIKYEVVADTGSSDDLSTNDAIVNGSGDMVMNNINSGRLEFLETFSTTKHNLLTKYPAIFETEPREDVGLDIYYEASGKKPTRLNPKNIHNLVQVGAMINAGVEGTLFYNLNGVFVTGITQLDGYPNLWLVMMSAAAGADNFGNPGSEVRFYNDDGSFAVANITSTLMIPGGVYSNSADGDPMYTPAAGELSGSPSWARSMIVEFLPKKVGLGWFNCWSFGNGVESNRIGDTYNKPYITNGVKASTTLLEDYKEEHRKYGLIYSGIYNSTSGVNNLNQFIAAEKITKDINPIYGSIQKLHSRSSADGDLITLCEDRILKILANKDALYNADGNPQLIANNNVLGQTIPFSGDFGISKNPESFASESYRIYFTDKVRGAIMRLSRDGLTPISDHGMKDWFRDNLKLSTKLIGSYDDRNNEYNITLADRKTRGEELVVNGNFEAAVPENFGDLVGEWVMSSGPHWFWDSSSKNMYSDATAHSRIGQHLLSPVTAGKSYEISWTVGKPVSGELEGRVWVTLHDDSTNYKTISPLGLTTVGTYTKTVTVDSSWVPWAWPSGTLGNSIYFHNKEWGAGYFNGTIDNISVREIISDPITVSFKEDVRGWVSFKSFVPENALSMASDYYSMLGGKLYQHNVEVGDRNNFYGVDYNSSVNVLLNDMPGSIKSYHTLGYEGSQSRVEGIKRVEVTGIEHNLGAAVDGRYFFFEVSDMDKVLGNSNWNITAVEIKQYRNNTLIYEGFASVWGSGGNSLFPASPSGGPTKGHGRYEPFSASNPGDWEVGDIITTQLQEDSVDYSNSTSKDGWHISNITTDKEKGSLLEFVEKEGKWFNYIKGLESNIEDLDFGSFEVQGLGIQSEMVLSNANGFGDGTVRIFIDGGVNCSLQVGDAVYYQLPGSEEITSAGVVVTNPSFFDGITGPTQDLFQVDMNDLFSNMPGPANGGYWMFVKNQVINMNGLSGYYADAMFENNSKVKAELFAVSSEITESSK